ncbi:excisionase family DNA binding protein [Lachnospiraceae bacterium PF1-21]|uniref:Helix-turn-helix domain-containing protein n=1 Tax=Ohessyouella blattaphilus TaxID=2949333 RepID=A0ABT1EK02_9FIRM|nr:helix-turn-helix domain-containing protein [Ohessyouella blattaphilus]MCP1110871.1 helix-turn-helix domain-containing protein [Ohessyouella blattaphilus]MCR8564265.1 helix-turn-helix domain-containing protein [Ohessyouella blattaphilus]
MFEEKISEINKEIEAQNSSYVKRTYTVDEIQDILGISQTTAYILIKQKLFHSVKVGRHIRISKKSFDQWLEGQE